MRLTAIFTFDPGMRFNLYDRLSPGYVSWMITKELTYCRNCYEFRAQRAIGSLMKWYSRLFTAAHSVRPRSIESFFSIP